MWKFEFSDECEVLRRLEMNQMMWTGAPIAAKPLVILFFISLYLNSIFFSTKCLIFAGKILGLQSFYNTCCHII
jgi:hypothetical protein